MQSNLVLNYRSGSTEHSIQSVHVDGKWWYCLRNIATLLLRETREIEGRTSGRTFSTLAKECMDALDSDESQMLPTTGHPRGDEIELFVTDAGVYRIVSRDLSAGAKKFQRWLFHDVLQCLAIHGTYPAPKVAARLGEADVIPILRSVVNSLDQISSRLNALEIQRPTEKLFLTPAEYLVDKNIHWITAKDLGGWAHKVSLEENFRIPPEMRASETAALGYSRAALDRAVDMMRN